MKIKLGCSRVVILYKNYAIKIPIFIAWRRLVGGVASNYKEWYECKRNNDNAIAKVHYCFAGLVLVAERGEAISEEEFKSIKPKHLKKLFNAITFKNELKWDNIGRFIEDGKTIYKIIDNGISLQRPKDTKFYAWLRGYRVKLGLL